MQLNFAIEINFYFIIEKYQYIQTTITDLSIPLKALIMSVFLTHRITRHDLPSIIKCLSSI